MVTEKLQILINIFKNKSLREKTNFVKYIYSLFTEPNNTKSLPIFVQIEPTVRCNLKCRMCINPAVKREKTDLEIRDFKLILSKLPYLRKLSFVGIGEPMLNPDIFEMIRLAKERGISIGFATNGMLLNKEMSDKIIESNLDWVNISIDGADKDTFESIRKGADFYTVIENTKRLRELVKNSGKPDISIWFLAMQSNFKELPDMVKLCSKLGVDKLNVQTVHCWGSRIWQEKVDKEFLGKIEEEVCNVFSRASEIAKNSRVRLNFYNIPDKTAKRACKWPWRACYISVDSYITPYCMNGTNPDVINFGNILRDDFYSIWNGNKYKEFRQALKSGNIPSICRDCTAYYKETKFS